MHRGFVKDYRKSLDHPLFKRPLIWHFWNYCRLRANHKDNVMDFNGQPFSVERGSFVTSVRNAAKDTGLTEQNIRTAIKTLVNHKMIEKSTQTLTQQATIIKVVRFDFYNSSENTTNTVSNTAPTQHQHSTNTVLTTNNNVKNEDNEENNNMQVVKKQPSQKVYPKEFERLWIDYKNSKGSKERTFKNCNKTKNVFCWSDADLYKACMNYQNHHFSEKNSYDYMYQLSNLVGENYRDMLFGYLDFVAKKEITAEIDPTEIARLYKNET